MRILSKGFKVPYENPDWLVHRSPSIQQMYKKDYLKVKVLRWTELRKADPEPPQEGSSVAPVEVVGVFTTLFEI